jgi:DNA-binding ferritin-like protein
MNQLNKIAGLYIATLRSMYLIYQMGHWTAKGQAFYSNHLLMQRLYESAEKDADSAAEKFIGLLGLECMDYAMQQQYLNSVLAKYKQSSDDILALSLSIESDFLKLSTQVYETFKKENKLSLGLDDMIMSIASSREEAIYLLSQTANKEMKIMAFKKNASDEYAEFNSNLKLILDGLTTKYNVLHSVESNVEDDGSLIVKCVYKKQVTSGVVMNIKTDIKKAATDLIKKFNLPITEDNIFINNILA